MALFDVRSDAIGLDECVSAVTRPEAGGIATFVGIVRNHSDGRAIELLEYHSYESMAKKQMEEIARGIAHEVPGVQLSALHRVGALRVGEIAVVCAASAPHRDEAFRACRALIDRIKAEVPVWKREHGPDGPYWVGWHDARCHSAHHHG